MATYEICVRGNAAAQLLAKLVEATHVPVPVPEETLLITERIDQDALLLLMRRLRDLGLELRGLRCSRA